MYFAGNMRLSGHAERLTVDSENLIILSGGGKGYESLVDEDAAF